ncbi:Tetratricopeptide repeat-containing protein [Amycolatopsis xylanica]|uniref:Tetratricopeptide repeat-containing protein n=1 Tax=Amycolatopsis xylanica TaxID=589385 RepID=A0A1H3P7S1_9PSEU|nr:LuxR family transcriptional regulator [Amycolatopsis xylanica]SDY97152.1 Tetratricopeptide repeat-containing protein [Amycolatopsis xylanica]
MLEREAELAELSALAERARAGRGAVAVIEGPPGIGRTAMLDHLAQTTGMRVLRAQGSLPEREFGLGLVRQLLEPVLATADTRERARLLTGSAELALRALDPRAVTPEGDFAALHGLFWLLANLAEREPVLLLVDDVDWADRASLGWLAYVARRLRELAVLVVLGRRGGAFRDDPAFVAARTLSLRPLSETAVRDIVGESDEAFAKECHRATGGNPQMLDRLLESLARHGAREADSVAWYASRALSEVIRYRLAELPPRCLEMARTLAIASDALEMDSVEARQAAHLLAESGLTTGGAAPRFVHEFTAETVLAGMSADEVEKAHAEAAKHLYDKDSEAEKIAKHLLETAPGDEVWRVIVLAQAARTALSREDAVKAGELVCRALREHPADPRDLLDMLAATTPWFDARRVADTLTEVAAGIDPHQDPELYAQAYSVLAQAVSHGGRPVEAHEILERAAIRVRGRDCALVLTAQRLALSTANLATWNPRADWETVPMGDTPGERALLAIRAFLSAARGDIGEGVHLANLTLDRGVASDHTIFPAATAAAGALLYCDRVPEAIRVLETLPRGLPTVVLLTDAYLRHGELAKAAALAESMLELAPTPLLRRNDPLLIAGLVDAYVLCGDYDRAERALARYPMYDGDHGWNRARFLLSQGKLRIAGGRVAEGTAALLEAGRRMVAWGWDNPAMGNWRSLAATGVYALGDHARARALAGEEVEIARASGLRRSLGVSLRVAGAITPGAAGLKLAREAVDLLEGLELAHALIDLGTAEHMAGAVSRARTALRQGAELAERCGAGPLARRGHAELRRAGGRPRGGYLTGARALTASERRVALLARQGHTNRQIAGRLQVAVRTVEIHLTSVYRKLGITARTDLATALR